MPNGKCWSTFSFFNEILRYLPFRGDGKGLRLSVLASTAEVFIICSQKRKSKSVILLRCTAFDDTSTEKACRNYFLHTCCAKTLNKREKEGLDSS